MTELLGRAFITQSHRGKPPASLTKAAEQYGIPQSDIDMLAGIRFRGDAPRTPERWYYIYNAIRTSTDLDRRRAP